MTDVCESSVGWAGSPAFGAGVRDPIMRDRPSAKESVLIPVTAADAISACS